MMENPEVRRNNFINARTPPPLSFVGGDCSKNWKIWYQQFEWYAIVYELDKKPENVKIAAFMSVIGPEAIPIFNTFSEEQKATLQGIVNSLESYFSPKVNVTYERFIFNKIFQSENEKFDDFYTELLQKCKSCDYGDLKDSLVMDRIVIGVYNDNDREKLLAEENLTLDKAVKICRAAEQSRSQLISMKNETPKIEGVRNKVRFSNQNKSKGVKRNVNKDTFSCNRCGTNHKRRECPAYKQECYACHKQGHFSKFCKSKKVSIVARQTAMNCNDNFIVGSVSDRKDSRDWYETIQFKNKYSTKIKLDSGAQCNVLPISIAKKANLKFHASQVKSLLSFSNHKMPVVAETTTTAKVKNKTYEVKFMVVNEEVQPVLGKDTCVEMELIKRIQTLGVSNDLINKELFEDQIGCLQGFRYEIDLVDNPKLDIFPARRIPYSIRDDVKKELDRMEVMGIIKPVTVPTPAVSPMVIVRRNGKLRVCIDPSSLNKNLKRRHYPLRTLEEIAARIHNSKWFTLLDCKKGFWQIPVTERTSGYLTMSTPWGRYSYLRMPMGLSSAPEVFQQVIEQLLGGMEGVECAMDDTLVHSSDKADLIRKTNEVIRILKKAGLTLNSEKCVYYQPEVKFLGHIVSDKGLKADPMKIEAITALKVPHDVTSLQRFLGMVTYLAKFIPNLSEITRPLRELCKKDVEWTWNKNHQSAFEKLKNKLKSLPILKYYDVNAPITLSVDSSKHAVGAVLLQEGRPIAYAAKALDKTQLNYAQIEKEAYAIKFGCQRFHQYVWGCKSLTVETDHKPLVSISRKSLHCAPPRLQRMLLEILPYRPDIIFKKGTELYVADTLSRDCNVYEDYDFKEIPLEVHVIVPMTTARTRELRQALKSDKELSELSKLVLEGWPENINDVPDCVKKYWSFRDEFSAYEGILLRGDRVVIPSQLREPTLKEIHRGHLGIQRSLNRARENVYWHGMNHDVTDYVKKCKSCQYHQRDSQEEPVIINEIPERPWQIVATDIYHLNKKNYLVIADNYSGYFDFTVLGSISSQSVIQALKQWFSVHGVPDVLRCDEGTQLISKELKRFAEEWNFTVQTSSPYHKRSNGLAERYVQEAKNLLLKCSADGSDIYLALLNCRNTPRGVLGSAVQRLMGRRTKGTLSTSTKSLMPKIIKNVSSNLRKLRLDAKAYRDRGSKSRPAISLGQQILFRKGHRNWTPAQVIAQAQGPRSFLIKTPDGKTYRRNSWFLRPNTTVETPKDSSPEQAVAAEEESAQETHLSGSGTANDENADETPKPAEIAVGSSPQRITPATPPRSNQQRLIKTRSGRVVKKPTRLNL